ncbi:glycosyltransferase [uncultured Thomasclavelia sp.]|uniref:glycosyltransferase n=1 Tax=uncultured Thomasclavelia sp. TaxID=3025759 RepID=UPI00280B21B1|nr:glycosyltransferase [uncultured Thomasclavelia sp.]
MNKIEVSIIMGVYNCEDTIDEAIQSILDQTFTNWEFIICDDCSTDNTYQKVQKYVDKYPDKIFLIKNEKNSKLAASLNHCLKYARGKYIARMDGDDISIKTRFERQVKFLDEHPEYSVVGSNFIPFNKKDIGITKVPEKPTKDTLKLFSPYVHATIMMRKEVYDDLGGYRVCKETQRCEDADLWFRFYHRGYKGYNIQEPLYKVREDMDAFKRRKFRFGLQLMKVSVRGFKLLDFPKYYYLFLLKPLLASFLPAPVMKIYHIARSK